MATLAFVPGRKSRSRVTIISVYIAYNVTSIAMTLKAHLYSFFRSVAGERATIGYSHVSLGALKAFGIGRELFASE